MDRDDDLDVVASARGLNEIAWWENNGDGQFTRRTVTNSFESPADAHVVDFDSDGDMDVLSTSWTANGRVSLFENDGTGSFQESIIGDSVANPVDVIAADLDNDGDLDVIATNTSPGSGGLTAWENAGGSAFVRHTIYPLNGFTAGLSVGDLDLDGDSDIVFSNHWNHDFIWTENLGSFEFEHHIIQQVNQPNRTSCIDLDQDGDIDIIANNIDFLIDIGWWRNDTLGAGTGSREIVLPEEIEFSIYPNPFNAASMVTFTLTSRALVQITVFDLLGRQVQTIAQGAFPAGAYGLPWNASSLASGSYILHLRSNSASVVIRATLIR